jgi:manganese oxidase
MLDNPSCSPAKLARLGLRRLRLFESFREIAVEIARRIDPFAKRSSQLFWLLVIIALPISPACFGVTRHYYIAAEDVAWDYAPSGRDLLASRAIPEPWGGHTKCQKTRYFQYTDSTFSTRQPQPEWLGILGPIIRAEVGDEIIVDFWNRSGTPHSIHPRGVYYDKNSEGAFYLPWGGGARITHNRKFTYRWFAKSGSGPRPGQLSSVVWWYHSEVDETEETNAGLLGPIIITAKGMARVDGTPKDVDREFVVACVTFRQLEDKSE